MFQKKDAVDIKSDAVIGMSDGLIVPFALATGLASAGSNQQLILAAGLLSAVVGGITMGIGRYFSEKDEPVHSNHDVVAQKSKTILGNIGIDKQEQQQAVEAIEQDHENLASLVGNEEGRTQPIKNGFIIMASYMLGAVITIGAYFFLNNLKQAMIYSFIIACLMLFSVGFVKGKISGANPFHSALRAVITGMLTAAAAFFVAKLF